jgi:peptidoglycan/xylan/chitin deacetylase (PgdA/CDA1 family)
MSNNTQMGLRLLKLIISLIYFIVYRITAFGYSISKRKTDATLSVLYYHEITSKSSESFWRQMVLLKKLAEPLRTDYSGPLEKGKNYVMVTFDDAFQSVLENAVPILINNQIPCTIFVPTAFIGKQPGWKLNGNDIIKSETVMTQEQIKNVSEKFVLIGSHTHTHTMLAHRTDAEVRRELFVSKNILEKISGETIDQLAFPYGSYNCKIKAQAKAVGYKKTFAIIPTSNPNNSDFLIGRINSNPYEWLIEFRLKVLGCYKWLPVAMAIKKSLQQIIF